MSKEEANKKALEIRVQRIEKLKQSDLFRKIESFIEESINEGFTGCIYKVKRSEVEKMDLKLIANLLESLGYKVSAKTTFVSRNEWQEKALSISWK